MRGYLPGDDIRSIDWKTTAKVGKPFVKVMTEERDRPTMLVVDQRMSMFFGSVLNLKSVTAAEAAAVAAFRIQAQGDRVGGIIFNDQAIQEFHPNRGSHGLNAFISTLSRFNCELRADATTEQVLPLNDILASVARIASHNHLVMIFSDFNGIDDTTEKKLRGIAEHNDLILFLVNDPSARQPQSSNAMSISDGAYQAELNLADDAIRKAVQTQTSNRLDAVESWQTRINLSVLPISAGEPTLPQIRRLLGANAPKRRVR